LRRVARERPRPPAVGGDDEVVEFARDVGSVLPPRRETAASSPSRDATRDSPVKQKTLRREHDLGERRADAEAHELLVEVPLEDEVRRRLEELLP